MGTDGDPKDLLSPMMCIAIWATTHEKKHCIGGKVRDDCPLVDIEERKVGKWIELEDFDCSDRGEYLVKCSICDTCNGYSKTDYCPSCGAEMRGNENV